MTGTCPKQALQVETNIDVTVSCSDLPSVILSSTLCFLCNVNTCGGHQAKVNSSGWKVRRLRGHRPKTNLQKNNQASQPIPYVRFRAHEFRITDTSLKALRCRWALKGRLYCTRVTRPGQDPAFSWLVGMCRKW